MTTASRSPKSLKAALVSIDPVTTSRSTILFQYNPDGLTRSLKPRRVDPEAGQPARVQRFTGAAVETIEAELELDAADQLEAGDADAQATGLYPQLSALELLLYPSSDDVQRNGRLVSKGMIEIGPYSAPLTLFLWGKRRVVPVSVTGLSIHEELFDENLNPLRATVSLSMTVLTYSEFDPSQKGYHLSVAHQQQLEALAKRARAGDANGLSGVEIDRL